MGKLMFGWDESVDCITPVSATGPAGEALCLAHKTSKLFVFAGVYVRDDGYVLRPAAEEGKHRYFPWPDAAEVQRLQSTGALPDPLPPYSISAFDYAFGYSLWLILAGMAAWSWARRRISRARQAREALIPISVGPPAQQTDGDRFLSAKVAELLQPGEQLQQQAYAMTEPESTSTALFLALTNQRLLVFSAKRGAFKPLLETTGVQAIARSDITRVTENAYVLTFHLANGSTFEAGIPSSTKHFTHQHTFVRDVPRLLAGVPEGVSGAVAAGVG